MALSYHHRLINKIRSILATVLTSYDPFAEKLLENFRRNPYYPFTAIDSWTFEYQYRRWLTIYVLILIQIVLFSLAIYCYWQISSNEYWISSSKGFLFISIGLGTLFLTLHLIESFQQIRIVLSPLDFHVSIYVNNHLKQRCSIDRAYICLHQIESYKILLYHLVFIIEDLDFVPISDYFSYKFPLRQIGKRLAANLFLSYFETDEWMGIFPKYHRLKSYIEDQ